MSGRLDDQHGAWRMVGDLVGDAAQEPARTLHAFVPHNDQVSPQLSPGEKPPAPGEKKPGPGAAPFPAKGSAERAEWGAREIEARLAIAAARRARALDRGQDS